MCTNEVAQWRGWAVGAGRGSRFESTLGLGCACCGIAESNRLFSFFFFFSHKLCSPNNTLSYILGLASGVVGLGLGFSV